MSRYIQRISGIFLTIAVTLLVMCCLYYNILYDILIIFTLFADSYAVGSILKIEGSLFEKMIIRTAAGMGIIGIVIYYILLIGVGNKSVYVALLVIFFIISMPFMAGNRQEISETLYMIRDKIMNQSFLVCILVLVLAGYLICGSAPISYYDTLTKHLPITIYAAENGGWYVNVTESIVYGEPMVLQYTYSTLFYTLGTYKALVLFNVVLYFAVYVILCYFIRKIYPKSSMKLLAVILLTTPLFFEFATIFYLEILPIYFLFSAFVGMGKLEAKKIWNNIEIVAFLCGCAVFVKLTPIFTIAVMVTVLVLYCIRYALKFKVIKRAIWKFIRCVLLGMAPSLTSLIYIWYKTGNPFFPNYNGIFKSPYYAAVNFSDPFTNKLTFSINSLFDIVFRTTQNIEMYSGGLGIFLLFIFVVPIGIVVLILKKEAKKYFDYVVWLLITIVAYIANTFATYNLRYYYAVWVLFACIITIGISICLSIIPLKSFNYIALFSVAGIILFPNLYYIKMHDNIPGKLVKDERIVDNDFCEVFDNIPQGKKVLSFTNRNQFKGQYHGYYASTTWHNATLNRINEGKYTWQNYLTSFDYILIDKTADIVNGIEPEVAEMLPDYLGQKSFENSACVLFEVLPQKDMICGTQFEIPQETNVLEPITEVIQNVKAKYYINHQILNENDYPIPMRYQINWMSKDGNFIDVYISVYDAQPGENEYCSEPIPTNKEADYGIVYITTANEQTVKIQGYTVEGEEYVTDAITNQFESRALLNSHKE